jgi:hypothetical protein
MLCHNRAETFKHFPDSLVKLSFAGVALQDIVKSRLKLFI